MLQFWFYYLISIKYVLWLQNMIYVGEGKYVKLEDVRSAVVE